MLFEFNIAFVKLEIDSMGTGREKLRQLKNKFIEFHWNVLQNIVSNILSNMA